MLKKKKKKLSLILISSMLSQLKLLTRRKYHPVSQTLNNTVERVVKFWLRSTVVDIRSVQASHIRTGKNISRAEHRRQKLGIPAETPIIDKSNSEPGNAPPLTEKIIHSLAHDFLELYELNSSVIQLVNMSSYRVHNKTYVLLPHEDYGWCVSSIDEVGKLSKIIVTPSQLGNSIQSMFSLTAPSVNRISKGVVEPEMIMAICRHYEMMWASI
jgi:hypothetical protein